MTDPRWPQPLADLEASPDLPVTTTEWADPTGLSWEAEPLQPRTLPDRGETAGWFLIGLIALPLVALGAGAAAFLWWLSERWNTPRTKGSR